MSLSANTAMVFISGGGSNETITVEDMVAQVGTSNLSVHAIAVSMPSATPINPSSDGGNRRIAPPVIFFNPGINFLGFSTGALVQVVGSKNVR